MMLGLGKRNF